MANPQAENGHTDIANEILDYLVTFRMSGQEWQVLMFVVRKTYGWHKKQDSISYGQISEFTHIPRRTVIRIIKKLVAKKTLVASGQKDTSHPNIFEFNKNYEEWTSGQKDTGGQKATRVVAKKTPELVAKKTPTKERK